MNEDQLDKMRQCAIRPYSDNKTLKLACKDGDVLQGIAVFVSDEDREVIIRVDSSNNPAKYRSGMHYLIKWDDITDFQELTDSSV